MENKKENHNIETQNNSEAIKLLEEAFKILEGEICPLLNNVSSTDQVEQLIKAKEKIALSLSYLKQN